MRGIRIKKSVMILMLALSTSGAPAFSKDNAPFTLAIVPNERHEDRSYLSFNKAFNPKLHFHAVLTNVSDVEQKLWNENCSQGYGKLAFQITDENGVTTTVKKKDFVVWEKNFPDWFTLKPKEQVIYDVYFLPDTWTGLPEFDKGKSRKKIKIRAFYARDDQSIVSPVYTYEIFRD